MSIEKIQSCDKKGSAQSCSALIVVRIVAVKEGCSGKEGVRLTSSFAALVVKNLRAPCVSIAERRWLEIHSAGLGDENAVLVSRSWRVRKILNSRIPAAESSYCPIVRWQEVQFTSLVAEDLIYTYIRVSISRFDGPVDVYVVVLMDVGMYLLLIPPCPRAFRTRQ